MNGVRKNNRKYLFTLMGIFMRDLFKQMASEKKTRPNTFSILCMLIHICSSIPIAKPVYIRT